MRSARSPSERRLPDGTRLHNRLLAALPRAEYERILRYVTMTAVTTGHTLHAHSARIKDVYFPNGGVFSVTNEMRNGPWWRLPPWGGKACLGLASSSAIGAESVAHSNKCGWPIAVDGRRAVCQGDRTPRTVSRGRQSLRSSESAADHAMHRVQRAAQRDPALLPLAPPNARPRRRRHLLTQTGISCHDARRASADRHTCPAHAPARGWIASRYGRIQILQRKRLEAAACECYSVIRAHFARLGL
jgi:hypothetical protein